MTISTTAKSAATTPSSSATKSSTVSASSAPSTSIAKNWTAFARSASPNSISTSCVATKKKPSTYTNTKSCRITGPDMSSNALKYRLRVSSRAQATNEVCEFRPCRKGSTFLRFSLLPSANSPCQTVASVVSCIFYTSLAVSLPVASLIPKQRMPPNGTIFVHSKSFQSSTSEPPLMYYKQRTCAILKSFRCSTYKKHHGWGPSFGSHCTCPTCRRRTVPEE